MRCRHLQQCPGCKLLSTLLGLRWRLVLGGCCSCSDYYVHKLRSRCILGRERILVLKLLRGHLSSELHVHKLFPVRGGDLLKCSRRCNFDQLRRLHCRTFFAERST